jgi:hypothetical protein
MDGAKKERGFGEVQKHGGELERPFPGKQFRDSRAKRIDWTLPSNMVFWTAHLLSFARGTHP